jgi:hypothetical protein
MGSRRLRRATALLFAVGTFGLITISAIDFAGRRSGAGATALVVAGLSVLVGLRLEIAWRRHDADTVRVRDLSDAPAPEARTWGFVWTVLVAIIGAVAGYLVGSDVTGAVAGALLGGFLGAIGGFAPIPREFLGGSDKSRR